MKRLLALAEVLCGSARRRNVIEPLVADWAREFRDAASRSPFTRVSIFVRGALALLLTMWVCSVRHALSPEGSMWKYGIVAFAAALVVALVLEAALIGFTIPNHYPPDMLLLGALRLGGAAALAPAMLPALFLLRRGANARLGTAASAIAIGTTLAGAGVIAQPWLVDLQPTVAQNERMYQWERARDRAGELRYSPEYLRELRDPQSTPESRKARYEQFVVSRAQQLTKESRPTAWQQLRRSTVPILAGLFGLVGWGLGGLTRPTVARAAMWWGVAWFVTLVADGRMANALGLPGFWFSWWTLPVFAAVTALALMVANTRHHATNTPAPTP